MKPEQRIWLASILSAFILVSYAQFLSKTSPRPLSQQASQPAGNSTNPQQVSAATRLHSDEGSILLETKPLILDVGRSSAVIKSVVLKNYQDLVKRTPLKIEKPTGVLSTEFDDEELAWQIQEPSKNKAIWKAKASDGSQRTLSIELDERIPRIVIILTAENNTPDGKQIPITSVAMWSRSDEMGGRQNILEAVTMTERTGPFQHTHLRFFEGTRSARVVPRGTIQATLSERFFCESIKPESIAKATIMPAERGAIVVELKSSLFAKPSQVSSYRTEAYIGPRDFFSLREAGFEQAFPLGLLAKIGLMLMLLLKGLAHLFHSYGIALILLAAVITSALSPFTMISYRSMKKMQELQPRMDEIRTKYAKDSQRANQEIMALFKEHKVSPVSGCLPMFLQMPIFFALWSAITHVIELRGERFLWINDLSLPDRLARLPGGMYLNILPVLMAGAMFIQSKLTQPKAASSSSASPFSGPMMSVLFGVMFYSVPAGLVLYWLTNTLTSITWYRLSKI